LGWLDYSAKVIFPFSIKAFPLQYSAWIRINPFDKIFIPSLSYERLSISSVSGLGLKDFTFPLDENCISSAWNIMLQSKPLEFIEGSFSCGKNISTTGNEATGYSSPLDWNIQRLSALLKIHPEESSSVWLGWKRREEKGEMRFIKNGLLFGDLAYGKFIFNNWQAGASKIILSLPVSCEYNFYRWVVYGVGHFESWPFTAMAASVFDNRLYYTIDGMIDVHQIESGITFMQSGWNFKPSIGLLYILPDLSWRQWEPDFLSSCIKNAKEEPFSILQCWMLRIGFEVNLSVLDMNIAVQMEQYIPISSKEREKHSGGTGPSTPVAPGTLSSTDGGRRIRLEVVLQ